MLIFAYLATTSAYLISSSNIESCIDQGNLTMQCENKLVVTLSIENDQETGTESLEATLSSIKSNTSSSQLAYPIKFTVSKSKVKARYPLNYLQDFNSRPQELLIDSTVFSCNDGANSNNPTCGWKYDSQHYRIWNSQGYCCTCSFEDFLGIDSGDYNSDYLGFQGVKSYKIYEIIVAVHVKLSILAKALLQPFV